MSAARVLEWPIRSTAKTRHLSEGRALQDET